MTTAPENKSSSSFILAKKNVPKSSMGSNLDINSLIEGNDEGSAVNQFAEIGRQLNAEVQSDNTSVNQDIDANSAVKFAEFKGKRGRSAGNPAQSTYQDMTLISCRLKQSTHKRLRQYALDHDTTIQEIATKLIEGLLDQEGRK